MSLLGGTLATLALVGGAAPMSEALRPRVGTALRRTQSGRAHRLLAGTTWRHHAIGPQNGPVALCIHGLTTPSAVFDRLAPRLAAGGWRVLSYDLYGRGLSDSPARRHGRGLFLEQITELLQAEEVDQPVLAIGYSMGGAIATAFAEAHPLKVRGLCLLAPGGLEYTPDRFTRFVRDTPFLGNWAMHVLGPHVLRKSAMELRSRSPECSDIAAVMAQETRRKGYFPAVTSSLRNMLAEDQTRIHAKLAKRGLPVAAIWGGQDSVIPLRAKDMLATANPSARQIVFKRADHGLPFTHAEGVSDAILSSFAPWQGTPD